MTDYDYKNLSREELNRLARDPAISMKVSEFARAELENRDRAEKSTAPLTRAMIVGLDIPFGDLAVFYLKAVVAAIPAAFLIAAVVFVLGVIRRAL